MTRRRQRGGPGKVRLVAGTKGGCQISVPAGLAVRPTPLRVREALFSILGERCRGRRVLDSCAGTGALGLEALSRGAASALFVEKDRQVAEILQKNVAHLAFDNAKVLVGDMIRLAPRLAREEHLFDLVFIDPPYRKQLDLPIVEALLDHHLLASGVTVVVEHPAGDAPEYRGLDLTDQRRYGSVALAFYKDA